MAEDRDPTKGKISGKITKQERDADDKANAQQDTRPSPVVEYGRHALREFETDK